MPSRSLSVISLVLLLVACSARSAAAPQLPGRNVSAAPNATEQDAVLLEAAVTGDLDRLTRALADGANIEARDRDGRTALLLATHANRIGIANALIEAGADVNAKDAIQDSPYLYAAAEGRIEILRLTLTHGADLRATNRYGGTGLIPAAHHGHVDVVRDLLGTSVNIDHVNDLGWTALLEAVILGNGGSSHTQIVRLLVAAGANVSMPDRGGVTALQHARRSGYSEIVAILEAARR